MVGKDFRWDDHYRDDRWRWVFLLDFKQPVKEGAIRPGSTSSSRSELSVLSVQRIFLTLCYNKNTHKRGRLKSPSPLPEEKAISIPKSIDPHPEINSG